ncbi:hypothetical protein BROUX41_001745 [Berkeleyomyces rouxiae]|uniref:uncharacterized protein n=1 Tax=Berkeleyomyces rouxiae TaxID=2035830 RepID=UPI003B7E7D1D
MDPDTIARLTDKVIAKFTTLPKNQRLIIAIAGIPGSGKTTLAQAMTTTLNSRLQTTAGTNSTSTAPPVVCISMDGFHYTRAYLSTMHNAVEAHARRGAAFTFDSAGWATLVTTLGAPIDAATPHIDVPGFDHSVKDPVQAAVRVSPESRIVICEGNYLAMNVEPWRSAAQRYDDLWLVEVDKQVARERLVRRHLAAGICSVREEAEKRADENDLVNGAEILGHLISEISEHIKST